MTELRILLYASFSDIFIFIYFSYCPLSFVFISGSCLFLFCFITAVPASFFSNSNYLSALLFSLQLVAASFFSNISKLFLFQLGTANAKLPLPVATRLYNLIQIQISGCKIPIMVILLFLAIMNYNKHNCLCFLRQKSILLCSH